MRRIGVLIPFGENDPLAKPRLSVFMQALADLGWTDGRNVRMDVRWVGDDTNRIRALARGWSACNSCCKLLCVNEFLAEGGPLPYAFPYTWNIRWRTSADKFGLAPCPPPRLPRVDPGGNMPGHAVHQALLS